MRGVADPCTQSLRTEDGVWDYKVCKVQIGPGARGLSKGEGWDSRITKVFPKQNGSTLFKTYECILTRKALVPRVFRPSVQTFLTDPYLGPTSTENGAYRCK